MANMTDSYILLVFPIWYLKYSMFKCFCESNTSFVKGYVFKVMLKIE